MWRSQLRALRARSNTVLAPGIERGLELQHGGLQQLTALTSRVMLDCGLRRVPADVALLSATL